MITVMRLGRKRLTELAVWISLVPFGSAVTAEELTPMWRVRVEPGSPFHVAAEINGFLNHKATDAPRFPLSFIPGAVNCEQGLPVSW